MIKLYTKTICPKCRLIKSDIINMNVNVEIINIEHHEEDANAIKEQGFLTLPVMTNGEEWVTTREDMIRMLEESI